MFFHEMSKIFKTELQFYKSALKNGVFDHFSVCFCYSVVLVRPP